MGKCRIGAVDLCTEGKLIVRDYVEVISGDDRTRNEPRIEGSVSFIKRRGETGGKQNRFRLCNIIMQIE